MMDDCISRQAAIDAVRDRMGKGETHIGDTFIECFEMILNALPSAHPTQTNTEPTQSNSKPTQDCVERQVVLDWLNDEWDGMVLSVFDGIRALPSAQPEPLTEEEKRLLKKLRSYHSGSYAKILDKLVASAQQEIVRCKDCLMHGVCRFEQGLGLDGYCSKAERRTDGGN